MKNSIQVQSIIQYYICNMSYVQFFLKKTSVLLLLIQSCPTLCYTTDCSTPGFPVFHYLPESTQVHWVVDAIQPSPLSRPLLLSSIFPSIGVFSSELAFRIKWSKCWSFSFSISPSNEYSRLIWVCRYSNAISYPKHQLWDFKPTKDEFCIIGSFCS